MRPTTRTFSWFGDGCSDLKTRRAKVEDEIENLIEKQARPHAQSDGGDIVFKSFDHDTGTVHVALKGACVGCSSSTVTLRFMVLKMLQHYIDEVNEVVGHDDEECSLDDDNGDRGWRG